MRYFLALLLALAMTVNAYASSAAQSRACCASEECPVVHCIEMGCQPGVNPLALHYVAGLEARALHRDKPVETARYLHNPVKEIWTPPD